MAKSRVWKYPDEIIDFIRRHSHEGSLADMRQRVNQRFGIELSHGQMRGLFTRHKIHPAPRKGRKRLELRITTPEQDAFILEHHKGVGSKAMTDLVNERFGTSFTKAQIKGYYQRNKLNSGLTGRFEKGSEPFNKGKTWDDFMSPERQKNCRKTQFKPGNMPHNGGAPVGTVRLRQNRRRGGKPYYWEKVEQPSVWRMRHVLEWERHNGPVPDGYIVAFANGDTTDCRIDNLILETRAQHGVKNSRHIRGYDRESALTANKIADIKMAITKAKKRKKGGTHGENQHSSGSHDAGCGRI